MTSPLQTCELGRWVQCLNEECPAHKKTVFKMVRIAQMVEHETQTWVCGTCGVRGVKKVSFGMT
jgi:hypothetical protein